MSKTDRPPTITEQTPPTSTSSEVIATELQKKDAKTETKPAEVEGTPKVEETPKVETKESSVEETPKALVSVEEEEKAKSETEPDFDDEEFKSPAEDSGYERPKPAESPRAEEKAEESKKEESTGEPKESKLEVPKYPVDRVAVAKAGREYMKLELELMHPAFTEYLSIVS